jgi:TRAP-type mannitol/chloroaromatic compound transport system permease small subunit
MARDRWRRRLAALGAFLFLGPFVVALPVFGFGRFVPDPPDNGAYHNDPTPLWVFPDWLGIITVAGFVLLVISAFLQRP